MNHQLCYLCLLVAFSVSCTSTPSQRKLQAREIPVITLQAKDTFLVKTYVSSIQAVRNVELRNKVSGYLERIHVDEGQQVKKGQLLFSIDPDEFETEVSKAQAILSNAKAEAKAAEVQVDRVKLLVDKNIISPTELEVAMARLNAQRAKIREGESGLTNTKTRLTYASIRAPFDGIINRIPFREGSLLAEGSLLTAVSDIKTMYVYFNIAEDEYLQYLRERAGNQSNSVTSVRMRLADGSNYPHTGKIETTSSQFDAGTGSIAFRAKFPNPERILRHGATGDIMLNSSVSDALMLPQKAVFEIQDKNYVFVVADDSTVKVKSFIPRIRLDDYYIVQSGLERGDRIVLEGTQTLKDGMRILPKEVNLQGDELE